MSVIINIKIFSDNYWKNISFILITYRINQSQDYYTLVIYMYTCAYISTHVFIYVHIYIYIYIYICDLQLTTPLSPDNSACDRSEASLWKTRQKNGKYDGVTAPIGSNGTTAGHVVSPRTIMVSEVRS